MAKKGAHLTKPIDILDEDLQELVGGTRMKRSDMINGMRDYAKANGLINPDNGNEFFPDALFKACFKEVGVKNLRKMSFFTHASKLTGGDAVDAGLIEY